VSDPKKLWSVTTLIKQGLGTSEPLCNWIARTTAETAVHSRATVAQMLKDEGPAAAVEWLRGARYRSSGKAKARGTELHSAAEALALGQPVQQVDTAILPYVEQYRRFLTEHEPAFLLAEAPVYSLTYNYAGTLDAVIELGGQRLVADIKTTDKLPDAQSRPPYPEAALQLCAYRRAELVGLLAERRYSSGKRYYQFDPDGHHEPMLETDGAVVITISPVDYYVTPVRTDDEIFETFLYVRECARWTLDTSQRVFGPQITPPARVAA